MIFDITTSYSVLEGLKYLKVVNDIKENDTTVEHISRAHQRQPAVTYFIYVLYFGYRYIVGYKTTLKRLYAPSFYISQYFITNSFIK